MRSPTPVQGVHVRYEVDEVGRVHAKFACTAPGAAARFQRLRQQLVELGLAPIDAPALVLLALILLDGLVEPDQLRQAWNSVEHRVAWHGRLVASWQLANGIWQRRILSPFTQLARHQVAQWRPFDEVLADAARFLCAVGPLGQHDGEIGRTFDDAAAWAHAYLPPYLACAVTGAAPLACVPDSALAREAANQALAPAARPDEAIEVACSKPEYRSLPELWQAIDAALAEAPDGTDRRRRRAMARRLALLNAELAGAAGAHLFIEWCMHLVEVGTHRTRPVVPETAVDYIRQIGPELLGRLEAILNDFDLGDGWSDAYRQILQTVEPGSKGKASAALAAFHAFAVESVDAPPLVDKTLDEETERVPRANVLHRGELAWISEALGPPYSNRFQAQTAVVFELLRATGARSSDIFSCRIDGVRIVGGQAILTFYPRPTDGRLKTRPSRRQVRTGDPILTAVLKTWLARRSREAAVDRDLLFGCPDGLHKPWRRTQSLALIGALVKRATGDRQIGPHVLRHTDITSFSEASELTPEGERRFHQHSAARGHGADVSTRRDYDHSFDRVLAREMGRLNAVLPMSLAAVSKWTGCSEAAVRKAASRTKLSRQDFLAHCIEAAAGKCSSKDIASRFSLADREPVPSSEVFGESGVDFAAVLGACRDFDRGYSIETAATRNQIDRRIAARTAALILDAMPPEHPSMLARQIRNALARERGVDFARLAQSKYRRLLDCATSQAAHGAVLAASFSWEHCRNGEYISLERPEDAGDLLRLFAVAGAARQVVVCLDRATAGQDWSRYAVEVIRALLRVAPQTELRASRTGRPRAYLLFRPEEAEPKGWTAGSVSGLHALMLAARIWRKLKIEVL